MADVEAGCTRIGLEGVTGAGKTEFSVQFAELCQEGRGPNPLVIDGGVAPTEELLIAKICAQLREVPRARYREFEEKSQRFLARLLPGMRGIGGAMIQDLAKVAGLDKAEKTIEAVANLLAGADAESDPYVRLAEADQFNRRALIIEYLQFIADLGNPLFIFIDNYEILENSAREFLRVLLHRKPANCLLLIAVNTEREPPSDWRSIFAPNIMAEGGEVYPIPDLSNDEIVAWHKADIGIDPDDQTVQDLVRASHGGRPAYLAMIISGLLTGMGEPRVPHFEELQATRRRSLSATARSLGDLDL